MSEWHWNIAVLVTVLVLAVGCHEESPVDPLVLPSGVVYCKPNARDSIKSQPGHFAAVRDGEPIQGIARLFERSNGLWRLDMTIMHEACYSTMVISVGHFPLESGATLSSFDQGLALCSEVISPVPIDFDARRAARLGDVIDDSFLNVYNSDTSLDQSFFQLTEVDFEGGYAKGNFYLNLALDTSCVEFRVYPGSTTVTEGVFIASLEHH